MIEYRLLVDEADPELEIRRGHEELSVVVAKAAGEALGAEVSSALFDRVRTCDNHCEFCFIYQLPKGMRKSLYLKDDDYRLSFLYGNFTTLTRFTELDLERVLTEGLSPLFVSIHATDPELRARMLRNVRGATSLRWLRALLDGGIEVHGQVVVCPGVNDGDGPGDDPGRRARRVPGAGHGGLCPSGGERLHQGTGHEATHRGRGGGRDRHRWSSGRSWPSGALGRRLVYAADEYYLIAGRPFPADRALRRVPPARERDRDGPGLRRRLRGRRPAAFGVKPGFFAWVDGAPAAGYRARATAGRAPPAADPPAGRDRWR